MLWNVKMKTAEEHRHDWLLMLIEKYGSTAELNAELGRDRTDATLSQIKNKARNSRSGSPRNMGGDLAREIEERLGYERGLFDSPCYEIYPETLETPNLEIRQSKAVPPLPLRPEKRKDSVIFDLLDVCASCGSGEINENYPEVVRSIEMPMDEARRLIGKIGESVKVIKAVHDSMTPTIQPDDLLFVDTSTTSFQGGEGIYLIYHDGGLLCKRISRVGKKLKVTSDNKHYDSWLWDDRMDDTRIIGRVLRALPMDFKNFGGI
jgi:phage repressor protein C with HTH and peptisase S24 domain